MSEWTIWAGLLPHRMVRLVVVCVPEPRRSGSLPPFPLVLSFLGLRYSQSVPVSQVRRGSTGWMQAENY